jgi:hypothetical protein
MERLPGVDVRIVADRARRPTADRVGATRGQVGAIADQAGVDGGAGAEP